MKCHEDIDIECHNDIDNTPYMWLCDVFINYTQWIIAHLYLILKILQQTSNKKWYEMMIYEMDFKSYFIISCGTCIKYSTNLSFTEYEKIREILISHSICSVAGV